ITNLVNNTYNNPLLLTLLTNNLTTKIITNLITNFVNKIDREYEIGRDRIVWSRVPFILRAVKGLIIFEYKNQLSPKRRLSTVHI
ncbi:MAG: hypothetical protein ACTSYM_04220, partial [Candidatus Baldrarchaeia archaeon]